ncbi:serpin-ZX-like [Camellia sinensis]|uniref:serpin-ZX-like n=1 Tax=Camellia sinensis TaxID=4442 RepID=UPI0010355D51|nr:serpin-ZX-like [Camellia sinensis]
MSVSFSDNHNSIRREEYNNKNLEEVRSFDGVLSLEEIGIFTSMVSNLKDNNKNNRITSPSILFANSVWIDRSFSLNPSYKRILIENKSSHLMSSLVADQVIDEVNSCVKNETKGLIKNFLPPGCLYGDTALLFANALYCKGQWDQKFDKTRTRNINFHLLDGEIVQVPFMTSKRGSRHLYELFGGYKILSIPYQGSNFSMYFFLPNETVDLPKLVKKLKYPTLDS